ncbi:unnamed protein product [Cylicocyclus nassatus]|uniref:Uncharacterized protein n=1 Tax=Cylicocyclus nassatus TaxID=53992 RepID=A0AA36GFJ3_CYLNA|nr:unnamed protein product [Cylicocyclus nassatus]
MECCIDDNNPNEGEAPISTKTSLTPTLDWCAPKRYMFDSAVYTSSSRIDDRFNVIARRLLQLCDRFDKEFFEVKLQ